MKNLPGFQSFQKKEDGAFYFQFLIDEGHPILISSPFSTPSKRDSKLSLVLKYAHNPARYKRIKEKEIYQFIIKSGNHRMVTKSVEFRFKGEMEKAIETLIETSRQKKNQELDQKTILSTTKEMAVKIKTANNKVELGRFHFDLTFYQPEKGGMLAGKITFPLKEKKVSFKGVNLQKIEHFLLQNLPVHESETVAIEKKSITPTSTKKESKVPLKEQKVPIEKTERVKSSSLVLKKEKVDSKENQNKTEIPLTMSLFEKGKTVKEKAINKAKLIEIQIVIPKNKVKPKDQYFIATGHAKSLEDNNKTLIVGNFRGKILANSNYLRIPIGMMDQAIHSGLYKLTTSINFLDDKKKIKASDKLEGVEYVNILNDQIFEMNPS